MQQISVLGYVFIHHTLGARLFTDSQVHMVTALLVFQQGIYLPILGRWRVSVRHFSKPFPRLRLVDREINNENRAAT